MFAKYSDRSIDIIHVITTRNVQGKVPVIVKILKNILKNAGAKSIFKTRYLAAHPGGTVKVGELVDSNLMTKYDNLFVCDCSVIPEAWGMPPTTTIIGLGKRLAKYLSEETK